MAVTTIGCTSPRSPVSEKMLEAPTVYVPAGSNETLVLEPGEAYRNDSPGREVWHSDTKVNSLFEKAFSQ